MWSAPGLTIRKTGPTVGSVGATLSYQTAVTNSGDVPADGVTVLPPFSPFSSGNDLSCGSDSVMAPALRCSNHGDADIYGVTELGLLPLGKLRDLMDIRI